MLSKEGDKMQELVFHPAWERTISKQDRIKIEEIFTETYQSINNDYKIIPIWQAVNHHGDFLITTLIHNKTDHALTFQNAQIEYVFGDETVATDTFTIPDLIIKAGTSMPWTFIFQSEQWKEFDLDYIGSVNFEND